MVFLYRPRQKHLLPFNDTIIKLREIRYRKYIIKIESNDKLKEISIKNRTCYYFVDIIETEDFDFANILIDEKSYENFLVYDVSYKF